MRSRFALVSVIVAITLGILVSPTLVSSIPSPLQAGQKWTNPNATVISWTVAAQYIGQTGTVQGTIVSTYVSSKGTVFLDFHYPYQGYFYGVIFASNVANFPCSPANFYLNREVRITGFIQSYKGSPEIIVSGPSQIEVAYMGFACS